MSVEYHPYVQSIVFYFCRVVSDLKANYKSRRVNSKGQLSFNKDERSLCMSI